MEDVAVVAYKVPARDLKAIIIFGRFDACLAGLHIESLGRVPDYKIKFIDFILVYALNSYCFGMCPSRVCVTCLCYVAI